MKVQVIHAGDFIKATPQGEVNLELSKTRIGQVVEALNPAQSYNFLVDWRNVTINFSMTDMFYLALELGKYKQIANARMSLLVSVDNFDRGEFLQLCAQNRGVKLAAFTEYEEALGWITVESELEL